MRLQRVASMSAAKGIEGSRPILARQRKFPVPEFREHAGRSPEKRPHHGSSLTGVARFRCISLYFPCKSGIRSRDEFATDCTLQVFDVVLLGAIDPSRDDQDQKLKLESAHPRERTLGSESDAGPRAATAPAFRTLESFTFRIGRLLAHYGVHEAEIRFESDADVVGNDVVDVKAEFIFFP